MRSQQLGATTLEAEVISVSAHGLWIHVCGKEYFLSHAEYPWFHTAPVDAVLNVQLLHQTHLRWPDLDVDLDVDSLEHPEAYPLVAARGSIAS
jgi:hypothetical protein